MPLGGVPLDAGGLCRGAEAQPHRVPTISNCNRNRIMTLLVLEALGALALFVFIVWWTMFSGRKNGEPPTPPQDDTKN